jgi:hypothetical protein
VAVLNADEWSIEKSEHSSLESQGFVGLTLGMPISMIDQFCCRVVIVGRP